MKGGEGMEREKLEEGVTVCHGARSGVGTGLSQLLYTYKGIRCAGVLYICCPFVHMSVIVPSPDHAHFSPTTLG